MEDADPASMTNDSSRFLLVPAARRKLFLVCSSIKFQECNLSSAHACVPVHKSACVRA